MNEPKQTVEQKDARSVWHKMVDRGELAPVVGLTALAIGASFLFLLAVVINGADVLNTKYMLEHDHVRVSLPGTTSQVWLHKSAAITVAGVK